MSVADDLIARYLAAQHAMQTGVKLEKAQGGKATEDVHLRVGVNTALSDHAALVSVLVRCGAIREIDYFHAIAEFMEKGVRDYEKRLGGIKLG